MSNLLSEPVLDSHPEERVDVRSLVGELVKLAAENSPEAAQTDQPEVVVDAEVSGFRCLLIRLPAVEHPTVSLSPREHEIARMVAKGYTNKTIARVLDISMWTVSTHLRRIFAKLEVCSRTAMTARLLEEGMLDRTKNIPALRPDDRSPGRTSERTVRQ